MKYLVEILQHPIVDEDIFCFLTGPRDDTDVENGIPANDKSA